MTQLLALLAEPTLPKLAPSDSFWLPVDASVTTRIVTTERRWLRPRDERDQIERHVRGM